MITRNCLFSLIFFLTLTIKECWTVQVTISPTITTVPFTATTVTFTGTVVENTIGNQGNPVVLSVVFVETARVPDQDMIISISSLVTDVNADGTATSTVSVGGTTVFSTVSDGSNAGGGTITSTATVTVTSGSGGGSGGSPGSSGGDKKVTLSPITRLVIVKQFLPPTTSTATVTITLFRVDETTVAPSPLTTTVTTRRLFARDPYYNHHEPNYNYY